VKTFKQFTNSRRIYELNIDSHPVEMRPTWSLSHSRDGTPLQHGLVDLEASVDCMSARLVARDWHGSVRVTIVFGVPPEQL
jgi:hypothetical protein